METVEKQTTVFPLFPQRLENSQRTATFPQFPQPLLPLTNYKTMRDQIDKSDRSLTLKIVALPN